MYLQEQIERQEKFKEIFRTELASSFNAYEVLRLKQFKKYKFFQIMKKALVTITIISVIAHIACVIYSSNKQCPDEVMIFFFIGWAALAISNIPQFMAKKIKKDFSNLIKANCSDKILKAFGYLKQSDYIFSYEEISNTGLFNNIYSTKRQDDTFSGTYANFNFIVTELILEGTSSGKNKRTINIFRGILLNIKTDKSFNGRTTIVPRIKDKLPCALPLFIICPFILLLAIIEICSAIINQTIGEAIPFIAVLFMLVLPFAIGMFVPQKELKTKNLELDKLFSITTTDEEEAYKILTPEFIDMLKSIKKQLNLKEIKCCFVDNNIYITLPFKKNLFEIADIEKSLLEPETLLNCYKDFEIIYEILYYFSKNI